MRPGRLVPPLVLASGLLALAAVPRAAHGACTLGCGATVFSSADAGQSVSFWASSTPSGCSGTVAYDWDFGDGSAHSSLQNATHVYTTGGSYTWTLTASVAGVTCVKTGTISVCGMTCSATVPASSRVGAPVAFQSAVTSTGCISFDRYDWDFGDGSAHSTASAPTHAYAAVGTYTWTLTVENFTQSCTATGTIAIGEAIACTGCEVTVPATGEVGKDVGVESRVLPKDCSGSVTYRFDFGDGFLAYWGTGPHAYCAPGTYAWKATVTIGGVDCVKTGTIVISPPSSFDCTTSVTAGGACPLEVHYWAGADSCGEAASYAWDFGDGTGSTAKDGTHTFAAQGTYTWSVTATLLGATCTRTGTVTVTKPAAIAAVGTATPRSGVFPLAVAFSGGAEPASCLTSTSYAWSFGDGSSSTQRNPSHTYGAPGLYTWTLTVNADGLTASTSGPIVVSAGPVSTTWAPQSSGTTDPIVDVHFTGDQNGWTAARPGLRVTADGCRSWTEPRGGTTYAVRFLDADTGFYTGYCGFSRTLDGGANWSGFWYSNCWGFSFTDVFPTSTTQVWLADSSGSLWRWTYAPGAGYLGSDWAKEEFSSTGASNLQSIWFTDADNGWAVGNGGRIVRVANATGATPSFSTQASGTSASLHGVVMLSASTGWIVGDGGTILHTSDGGATWPPTASGTTLDLRAVDFRDAATGWIAGDAGLVLATGNGGASWAAEASPTAVDLVGVSAPPGSSVYAVGAGGTLLKRLPVACSPVDISPATLPDATTSHSYSQKLAGSGGTPPYTFGIAAGAPPTGITLATDGTLSGWPTAMQESTFTARAVDAGFCSGDRAYTLDVTCAVEFGCSASAYQAASPPLTGSFRATATTECGAVTYLWSFGDGATSPSASAEHTYAATGTYSWTLTATSGTASCSRSGTITINAVANPPGYAAGMAHAGGAQGSVWRSNLAAVNRSPDPVSVTLTYVPYGGGTPVVASESLAGNATREWNDLLVSLFGQSPSASIKGTVKVESTGPLATVARTYNQGDAGTFGQYLPVVPQGQDLGDGDTGVIPLLKNNAAFRSNIGLLNTGTVPATARIFLRDASGAQLGSSRSQTVGAGQYWQLDGAFAALGAGTPDVAYATVTVTAPGGSLWAFGSVVDNATNDPTTVPAVPMETAGPFLVAGMAHAPGAQGSAWRSNLGIVCRPTGSGANLTLTYVPYGGGGTVVREWSLAPGAAVEWQDVLVSLFGLAPSASNKGTVQIASTERIVVAARTYNQGSEGTFGQYLPAITVGQALVPGSVGVIPLVKNNLAFRSNLGLLNVGSATCTVRIRLFHGGGAQVGSTRDQAVGPGRYWQQDGVFPALGAGTQDLAYATVEVLTSGGTVWAFGSVVDNGTNDPTTVPVVR